MFSPDIITLCLSAISATATCAWVLRNWHRQREDFPKIDLSCGIKPIIRTPTHTLVDVTADVKNSGKVRHSIKNMTYNLRGARKDSLIEGDDLYLSQVIFPIVIRSDQRFFPASWVYSFVDSTNSTTYRNVILVPNDIDVFHLTVRMQYDERKSDFHSASWTGTCVIN